MNDLDATTFAQFARRFAGIDELVPEPPRLALAPVAARRSGLATQVRPASIVAVVLLLVATLALSVIGSPPRPKVTIPPDSAPAAAVLDAYLRALQAGDCDTAGQLTKPLKFGPGMVDICGVTGVTAFSVAEGPVIVDPDTVRFTAILVISGTEQGISAGEIRWTYFLQKQSSGAWRITNGAGHVPPWILSIPSPP